MGWTSLIADLHGRTPPIRPDSRLLLLAGDVCPDAGQREWLDGPFRAWLASLPCPVVAVPGNHDKVLEHPDQVPAGLDWDLLTSPGLVEVRGINIFGLPGVLDGGAFRRSEEELDAGLAALPDRCDVLLCHNPPLGIQDRNSVAGHPGSLAIRCAIWRKKPRLCVFGHIHEGRGWAKVHDTYCVNATLGAGCNRTGSPIPAPYGPWGLSDSSWRPNG